MDTKTSTYALAVPTRQIKEQMHFTLTTATTTQESDDLLSDENTKLTGNETATVV
jgi:hypothetical protein